MTDPAGETKPADEAGPVEGTTPPPSNSAPQGDPVPEGDASDEGSPDGGEYGIMPAEVDATVTVTPVGEFSGTLTITADEQKKGK